ncbi:hypothetical protein SK128_002293 [Halocaridina rubra]|uniref:Uncharacterized protein n=1 Tax=Halocaridina rubra TaxID=373956 RepID=A0AAN8XF17_HALRR
MNYVMESKANTLLFLPESDLQAVESNEAMEEAVKELYINYTDSPSKFILGIFVDGMDDEAIPVSFQYSLRLMGFWDTDKQFFSLQLPGPRIYESLPYRDDGFVLLQTLIDRYFISKITADETYLKDVSVKFSIHWI